MALVQPTQYEAGQSSKGRHMKLVVDPNTKKVLGFDAITDSPSSDDAVPAGIPEGAVEIELDITAEEFMQACEASQGHLPVGEMFLHDTIDTAAKTPNPAKPVGGKFVESHYQARKTAKERILERRAERNIPANAPVSLDELEFLNV
jgi:hypothetical protein